MTKTTHVSGNRRALRSIPLVLLTTVTLVGAAACGSSGSPAAGTAGTASTGATAGAIPAGLSAYFPGTKATGAQVKIGLINNEGSSPSAEPSLGDAAVAAADYANAELGNQGI